MNRISPALSVGLLLGLAFFAHALIPNSHAWPMIWPLAAGSAAVIVAGRKHMLRGFWNGIGIASKAGVIASSLFFVATLAALFLLSNGPFEAAARQLGAQGPVVLSSAIVSSLAMVALAGILLSILAGAATFPIVGRPRHSR